LRKINTVLIAICLLTFVGVNSVSAEDYKIGAVNTTHILEQSPQAVSADALIKKEFASRDRTLVDEQKKIKSMEDRLAKDGAIMSESERKKLERDIVSGRRDMKRDQDEFREDVNFRFNEERAKIQKEVFDAIVKVAKEEGYDLVLFDGVAFASPKVDISESVISHLKNKK
jgi:outer membrane protein